MIPKRQSSSAGFGANSIAAALIACPIVVFISGNKPPVDRKFSARKKPLGYLAIDICCKPVEDEKVLEVPRGISRLPIG